MKNYKKFFFFVFILISTALQAELVINSLEPVPGALELNETEFQDFLFSGYDNDGDTLFFNWELDSITVSTDSTYIFSTDHNSAGVYGLNLAIRDSVVSQPDTTFSWTITVQDVDQLIQVNSLIPAEGTVNMAETDSLQFSFSGYDPDGNSLLFDWQLDSLQVSTDSTYWFLTDFESAGSYQLQLTVTDQFSRNDTSFSWTITVEDVDRPIVVNNLNPAPGTLSINESESLYFTFNGYDPDGSSLNYSWKLDSQAVSTANFYLYQTYYTSAGQHFIELAVSDGFSRNDTTFQWTVNVNDADQLIEVEQLFPAEGSVNLVETDSLQFIFSGFDPDGNMLLYDWQLDSVQVATDSTYLFLTDLDSAGNYELQLAVTDQFSRNDTTFNWAISVSETDRIVVVDSLFPAEGSYQINELEEIEFLFSGYDPDGDTLSFNWEVDSITVSTDSIYTFTSDYESAGFYDITLNASDNFSRNDTTFSWLIEVLDVDREIVVDSLFPIEDSLTIAENDSVQFYFSGYDPDGDTLSYNWLLDSLLVSTDSTYKFLTNYNSAGDYGMNLNVSDGASRNDTTFSWYIEVTDVDQEIIVDSIYPSVDSLTITEFEQIEFGFSGSDPDAASLTYNWLLDSLLVSTDSVFTFNSDETSSGSYELNLLVDDGFGSRNQLQNNWNITVTNTQLLLVPEYFSTIQAAIDASVNGDTVLVARGIYPENISFNGKNIVVTSYYDLSRDPALIDSTIIDGSGSDSVVSFNSGEDSTAVLQGFTIRNGNAADGGGISVEDSGPILSDLKICNNSATARGGGLYSLNSDIRIENCEIDSNTAFIGAGAEFKSSTGELINCEIFNNAASFIGGGVEAFSSSVKIYNNVIRNNSCSDLNGGGIAGYNNSSLEIMHCTIDQNAANSGGGIAINNSALELKNSIISNNLNYGLYFETGSLDVTFNNFWNNSSSNFFNCGDSIGVNSTTNINGDPSDAFYNIQLDPLFNGTSEADLSLSDLSLCIGAGDSLSFLLYDKEMSDRPSPPGSKPDLGAYENPFGSPFDAAPVITYQEPLTDTLYIAETDSIDFLVSAYDPNGREVYYSWSLDSLEVAADTSYTFYTDYFSEGTYELVISVTDSSNFSRADSIIVWTIEVADVDREIVVNFLEPTPADSTIIESDSINFVFSGYDPDLNPLLYSWQIDSLEVATDSLFNFITDFTSAGDYLISLNITDGTSGRSSLYYEWQISVENVSLFNVPELITTIQGAIDVAVDGDTVLVAPGQYVENLNFLGKEIIVTSNFFFTSDTSFISQTIIDGSSQTNQSLIAFTNGETNSTRLSGFKLSNGAGYNGNGGGIRCVGSSPCLSNLIISENSSYTGGGIYCSNGASPLIIDCIIRNNLAFEAGAIHSRSNSSPVFKNCLIVNNSGLNRAGAIGLNSSSPAFMHCTIADNYSDAGSGFYATENSQPTISSSIIWNEQSDDIFLADSLSNATIDHSIVRNGWAGTGNLAIDPLFTDSENGVFTFSNYSYAIGTGDPALIIDHDLAGNLRPDPPGSAPDVGCYENNLAVPADGPIIINQIYPSPGPIELDETDSLEFYVKGYDLNGAELSYDWQLDSETVSTDSNFIFLTDLDSAGEYFLLLTITDNYSFRGERSQTGFAWNITVNNVIPPAIPENITISFNADSVQICWEPVADATGYKVYSSSGPESVFEIDLSGEFEGTCWTSTVENGRRFYRITAEK